MNRKTAPCLALAALLGLAWTAPGAAQGTACERLPAPEARPGDQLGCSVAMDGRVLAAGANLADGGAGSVTLFDRASRRVLATLRATAREPGAELGFALAIAGDLVAAGAPGHGAGAVYLFERAGGSFREIARLTAADGARGDRFGHAVAVSGGTVLVGAPNHAAAGSLSGAAYLFHRSEGGWRQAQKLTAGDAAPFDSFGFAVALDGATAAAGAPFADGGGRRANAGAVYVFAGEGGELRQQIKLTAPDTAAGDQLGVAVALDGGTLVAGARGDDVGTLADAGSAAVFERRGGRWAFTQLLVASDAGAGDQLGGAARIDGDRLVLGARFHRVTGRETGAAYLFERSAAGWAERPPPLAGAEPRTGFGQAVAIAGDAVLVGAFLGNGSAGEAFACATGAQPAQQADLSTVLNTNRAPTVAPGGTATYRVRFRNAGPADVAGARVASSSPQARGLPASLDLAAGQESGTFLVRVPVPGSTAGSFRHEVCILVPDSVTDPVPRNDCRADADGVTAGPGAVDLVLALSAPPSALFGAPLTYTLTVTNHGPATATGVVLRLPFPGELLSPRGALPAGCAREGSQIACKLPDLPPGGTAARVLTFDVLGCPQTAELAGSATATAVEPEAEPADNTAAVATPCLPTLPIPALGRPGLLALALLLAGLGAFRLSRAKAV